MKVSSRRVLSVVVFVMAMGSAVCSAEAFRSRWSSMHDRVWVGADYWANPMEDWCIDDGRLVCINQKQNRNVVLLTETLGAKRAAFEMSVRIDPVGEGEGASEAGLRVGIKDGIADYRAAALRGKGLTCGVSKERKIHIGKISAPLPEAVKKMDRKTLRLTGTPAENNQYVLTLALTDRDADKPAATISANVPADQVEGLVALVHGLGKANAPRIAFSDWQLSGEKVEHHPERALGPILWSQYTLSNSRGKDGYVMKMTAQMPPIGRKDTQTVCLRVQREGRWQTLDEQPIHPDARIAAFRIPHWDPAKDVKYQLAYKQVDKEGKTTEHDWSGTIRKEPIGRPLRVAGLTCQNDVGFPYEPVARNLLAADPDLLFFSGDQIYESHGGYGIIREPADRSILNYLRKWYQHGWSFGRVMRDRPTLSIPDDHDVFHGNLWGERGKAMQGGNTSTDGGYRQPVQMVNAVHLTQTAHHPDFYDPTPIEQGMTVYYGDMVYGRVSFAIVGDRQFKSGPEHVCTWKGRADHVRDPKIDVAALDKPGLKMLGDRQIRFLEHWVTDWRGSDMKVLLSETNFCNVATHHGGGNNYLIADLDSGGWPQSARNRALRLVRKAFAFHISGDQHLATLVHQGVDAWRDAIWSFCTPAISVGYQRWWRPDEVGRSHANRPRHNMPHTGEYLDGFGNKVFVRLVANPTGSRDPDRYKQAQLRASGFGLCVFDQQKRTIDIHCYRFDADLTDGDDTNDEYPGWPVTIHQFDNYSPKPAGYLPRIKPIGMKHPVILVFNQKNDELVYAIRFCGPTFLPKVFEPGKYTVKIGDPDTNQWKTLKDIQSEPRPTSELEVKFD